MFRYPTNYLDNSKGLLSLLGTFWTLTYDDSDTVEQLLKGRAQAEAQNLRRLAEAGRSISRLMTPVFSSQTWLRLGLKESEKTTSTDPSGSLIYTWPLPDTVAAIPLIFNRLTLPSATLVENIDFTVDRDAGSITFRSDPFSGALFAIAPLEEDDREVTLWAFKASLDLEKIYLHWGYVFDLKLDSSPQYLDLVNTLADAAVVGSTARQLTHFFSLVTGIPMSREEETVESVTADSEQKLIVTDKNVYRAALGATVVVVEGDLLQEGDPITDGLLIDSLSAGVIPAGLTQVSMGRGFLADRLSGPVIFENQDVELVVLEGDSQVSVRFSLGGTTSDIDSFWAAVDRRGQEQASTLADLLRIDSRGTTEAANLPTTINPLQFLIGNVLRFNTTIVRIKTASLGTSALGLALRLLVKKVIPPEHAVVVFIDDVQQDDADPVTDTTSSSSASPSSSSN